MENTIETVTAEIKSAVDEIKKAQELGASQADLDAVVSNYEELKSQLAELQTKMNRPQVSDEDTKSAEYKAAFENYLKTGDDKELKTAALYSTTAAEGGYAIPTEVQSIITNLRDSNSIRQYANVITVASGVTTVPIAGDSISAGVIGESATHTATTAADFSYETITTKDLYVNFPVSNKLIASVPSMSTFVANEVGNALLELEGEQFITGTGATVYLEGLCATGNGVTATATAATGTFTEDELITLFYSLKQGYRSNAVWFMNGAMISAIRKMKSSVGGYTSIWAPSLADGQPETILGRPVVECDSMASDYTSGNYIVGVGDLRRGYTIVDQASMGMLINPYAAAGFTSFQLSAYVGAAVVKPEAIAILKAK